MTTIIDVIDTAVKIGLGSLITGGVSYILFAQKHKAESASNFKMKKASLILDLSLKLEAVETHVNEAIVFYASNDIKSAKKALIPASNEAYTARALTNMFGNSEMITLVEELSVMVEKIYEEISIQSTGSTGLHKLAAEELPSLKKRIYPHIKLLYHSACA